MTFTERFYPLYNGIQDDMQIARQAWQELTESGDMSFAQLISLHNKIDQLYTILVEMEKAWCAYCAVHDAVQKLKYELAESILERLYLEELAPIEAAYAELLQKVEVVK